MTLALLENLQRVDLSHAEKVAALDQLAEITQAKGLRKTAVQLHVHPSWLSRQLSVRKDPDIFPELEKGRLGFGQAAELLRAPAAARRSLIQQVLATGGTVSTATIRVWVDRARGIEKLSQGTVGGILSEDSNPTHERARNSGESPYRTLVLVLKLLGGPETADDLRALDELIALAENILNTARSEKIQKKGWVEMNCIMCGDAAAIIEDGGTVRALTATGVRSVGRQLVCGRCGGTLLPGDRGTRYAS
jgi:hypothetical protein